MNNAELIVHQLEGAGVRWVFGIPSGPVLPLIEALRRSSIQYVLVAHEGSAGFMASAVGALTGVPGVCAATLGPGATNMTTGVGAAWLDRAPVIAITCNVATPWLDRRIQMRIDHHALFSPLTKGTFGLREGNVAQVTGDAIALACAEPPGPVHLDLPEDVAVASAATEKFPEALEGNQGAPPGFEGLSQPLSAAPDAVARRLASALAGARRPLVVTGLTFTRSRAPSALLRFVEQQGMPFISTLHAKGFLPESHPNWAGVLGRARRSDVQRFVDRAGLIIAVGYDPIEINYEEWTGSVPVFHISTDAADVSAKVQVLFNEPVDMDAVLRQMAELPARATAWSPNEFPAQRTLLDANLRPPHSPLPMGEGQGEGMAPHQVLDVLRSMLPPDGILAYDVGAHTHQIATQWRTDVPFTCLATNGWSSMGYGMPAAYAAKLVHPDRPVVAVVGDGGFQMTAGELAMARRLGLRVPVVVLNDGWLGLMKVKQEHWEYPLHGVRLGDPPETPPHYFGVPARGVRNERELRDALEWGLELDGPSVVEALVDAASYSQTVFD